MTGFILDEQRIAFGVGTLEMSKWPIVGPASIESKISFSRFRYEQFGGGSKIDTEMIEYQGRPTPINQFAELVEASKAVEYLG